VAEAQHKLTRDEALAELNDRIGQEVEVTVYVKRGDSHSAPVSATGPLRSWRDSRTGSKWAGVPREDFLGVYDVGSASFDFTDADDAAYLADPGEAPYGVRVELRDEVAAEVVWGA
jgi:hypothetical protein